jgi:RNA polymerase sigma factor for flagellar operon FliA
MAQLLPANSERVVAGLPFVEALARRLAASMPHSIDIGDLVQDGVMGLMDAANRFDEARGIKFETFAERRVRGAMIDALRREAWPRGVRRARRELEAAREQLRLELGCEPSLADLAARVGSDEKRLGRTIVRINTIESTSPLSAGDHAGDATLPAVLVPSEPESPDVAYVRAETRERVRRAITSLPKRERRLISLYYFGDVTMKQIGAELGVNESRVSQLHARAIQRLRQALAPQMASLPAVADRPGALAGLLRSTLEDGFARREGEGAALRDDLARDAEQVDETEWLRQPAAARLLQEALGIGSHHVTGDEDDAHGERRPHRGNCAVELHAVDARHLEVAHDQVVVAVANAGEGLLAVARPLHLEPRIRQSLGNRRCKRRLVFDDEHRGAFAWQGPGRRRGG